MKSLNMRAVQIDLARQIETIDTVKAFFDVAAESGMNMVFMYLEDRIKTATYPYSPDGESYSPDDIREMVEYATALGLDLVPVVSPTGHTERFLRHPELKHLAELRGRIAGAFSPAGVEHYMATCPNLPETQAFFDAYLTEVAALFPSKYFHIGFDEIHDMGYCALCKNTPKSDLFFNALMHYYQLLKGLGKEVMIWDDMTEQIVGLMDRLPKDIIVGAWFYMHTERYPVARFCTSRQYDIFGELEKRGIRYFGCCWRGDSVESLTTYAAKRKPWGMLMTNWEMSNERQIPMLYPFMRLAGMLWKDGEPVGVDTLRKAASLFADTEAGANALMMAMMVTTGVGLSLPGEKQSYAVPKAYTYAQQIIQPTVLEALNAATGNQEVLEAYRIQLRLEWALTQLGLTGYALHEYRTGDGTESLEFLHAEALKHQQEVQTLSQDIVAHWRSFRPTFDMTPMQSRLDSVTQSAAWLVEATKTATTADYGRLLLTYHLSDYTAACKARVTLQYADGSTYEVCNDNYKAMPLQTVQYERSFEIPADKVPQSLTITVSGYGAVGFERVSLVMPDGKQYVPAGVTGFNGIVEHTEALLSDDTRAVVLGEPDMMQCFEHKYLAHRPHSVTVALREW